MKKIISMFLALTLICSFATTAIGADKEARQPDVYVNEVLVEFADQNAYITDEGRTLVPARGVFEALDCTVEWDADNYVVTVSRPSQKKEIVLKIDDVEMKVITDGKETIKTLEVPAQLMNNRTMIPLRAVSETLGCAIIWNEGEYSIRITEMKQISAEEFNEKLQLLFNASQNKDKEEEEKPLTEKLEPSFVESDCIIKVDASETMAKVGDVITVALNIENNPGVAALLFEIDYDKEAFELVSMTNGNVFDEVIENLAEANLFWVNAKNVTKNGTLATLEFVVTEKATAGEYIFDLKYDPYEDVISENMDSVGVKVDFGKVVIEQ